MNKLSEVEDLISKYQELIDAAKRLAIDGLFISQEGNKLVVSGETSSVDVKNKLWDLYSQLNPNYIANDVNLDIRISRSVTGTKSKLSKQDGDVVILRKGPGAALDPIAELKENGELELLGRVNDNWWLVRTSNNDEGYCYAQYLKILD